MKMKISKTFLSLGLSLTLLTNVCATTVDQIPEYFSINTVQGTPKSVQIVSDNQLIGSLTLSSENNHALYTYIDEQTQEHITIKFIKYYGDAFWFYIYDENQNLSGQLIQEPTQGSRTRFELFAADGKTKLASGQDSVFRLKTRSTIYEKNTWNVLANVSRNLFTFSRDAKVSIDKSRLSSSELNPNMFLAVLSLQSFNDIVA